MDVSALSGGLPYRIAALPAMRAVFAHGQRVLKIAIVGDARTTRAEAPFDDPSWEIWGLHTGWHLRRCTRIFDLHDATVFDGMRLLYSWESYAQQYRDVPTRFPGVKMYRHPKSHDLWPNAEEFPFTAVLGFCQALNMPRERTILTSTVAWLIAFALLHDPEEIGIYGVDMDAGSEYGIQRTGGEQWVGIARGRGVRVVIPDASLLCATPFLYGLEMERNAAERKRIDHHERQLRYQIEDYETENRASEVRLMQMHARRAELEVWRDVLPEDEYARRVAYLDEEAARWAQSRDTAAAGIHDAQTRLSEAAWMKVNWTIADPPPSLPDSVSA